MNKCYFLARTTRDFEIRYTQNNTAVGRSAIAVDTGYGDNKKTNFFNVTAWGKTAESLEKYAPKGTKLLFECQAVQNQYTDKNDNKVNTVEFHILNFEFAESKSSSQQSETNNQKAADNSFIEIPEGMDSELPFV